MNSRAYHSILARLSVGIYTQARLVGDWLTSVSQVGLIIVGSSLTPQWRISV